MENNYYYNNYGYPTAAQAESELSLSRYVASVMRRVYGKMFLGLLVTAITSLLVLTNETLMTLFLSSRITFFVLAIAELGLVFYLSARIDKLQPATATALFYLYAVLNGVTLTPIFLIYTGSSIALTFGITSVTFGAMCLYGYVTKQDLSKMGAILFMALIGLILCTIVNLFLHSSTMDWIISLAGVAIFVGLTAWDTQNIKRMVEVADPGQTGKIATLGALSLYLDFINLFIYLLRIFGSRD
ncbi:MAG: Bax inhibitor-1/YccA family protein [Muribaculaceae bacterium]|nr:Bax inhibitor-1/YccA family protein [Muribaculaceae bacterium]